MAGADLQDSCSRGLDDVASLNALLRSALDAIERLRSRRIARDGRHALGGGCELALACDFRLMARGRGRDRPARGERGLLAAGGGTQRALRNLGRARALEFVMRGSILDADEAERIGLITKAVDGRRAGSRDRGPRRRVSRPPAMAIGGREAGLLEGDDLTIAAASPSKVPR